jgi:hypothetical protein
VILTINVLPRTETFFPPEEYSHPMGVRSQDQESPLRIMGKAYIVVLIDLAVVMIIVSLFIFLLYDGNEVDYWSIPIIILVMAIIFPLHSLLVKKLKISDNE